MTPTPRGRLVGTGAEAALIAAHLREGKLVPAEITIRLLRRAMRAAPEQTFLVDGFPRALDQMRLFEEAVDGVPPRFVLYFDVTRAAGLRPTHTLSIR